ncbi:MAG: Pycsar system effector family protein [Prolixibacteraceae bacterium]
MEITDNAKLFVIDYFRQNNDPKYLFHTLDHTLNVAGQAEKIGKEEKLSEPEMQAVLIAAWFHDVGYLIQPEDHESFSIRTVRSFFEKCPVEPFILQTVEACIHATRRDHEPLTLPEKVIMDADVSHLGDPDFISISKKLRKERSICTNCEVQPLDYWKSTLAFMERQQFYTSYALAHFQPVKLQNIEKVKELIREQETMKPKKTNSTSRSTEKGVESMFRLTAGNQMRLSAIADKKANILISINSVLLSVSAALMSAQPFSNLLGNSFPRNELLIPVIILFFCSLLSLVFAILSCRPLLNSEKYTEDDLKARRVNLLFFGNFHQINYPRYQEAMKEMMNDYDYLYSNMIKDQYYLGKSLFRKYKLLRTAYDVFMYGFILAAVVFVVMHLMAN